MSPNGVSVKDAYLYTASAIASLEASLSPERIATYVAAAGGDREKALRLYTWNTAASAAFYGPLQGLEIALRNGMHGELGRRFGARWYDDPACGLDAGALRRVQAAKDELARDGFPVDPPRMVAAFSFGFWVSLLGPGGRLSGGYSRANYEMTLWRPCLHKAFPNIRAGRRKVHQPLDYLRTFRNRIAHHEPIFARHLAQDYASILEVTGWVSAGVRSWIDHHSRVGAVLGMSVGDDSLKF